MTLHKNALRLFLALILSISSMVPARAQNAVPAARDLVKDVAANELRDRTQQRKWMYTIEKRVGDQSLTEQQVETADGPIYRVIAINGVPLNVTQKQADDARLARLLSDPSQLAKLRQHQADDEQKLENMMRIMPDAFLYDYDGMNGKLVRVKFRPDPNYDPPTYEARVAHSLAGTMLIDGKQKRLARLSARVMEQVNFGFGFLGHIDKGGSIDFGRVQVGPAQWKTALIRIQLSGRVVFFKTIDKQENEIRSNFRPVGGDLSLAQATGLIPR